MEAQQCVKLSLTNRSIGLIPSSLFHRNPPFVQRQDPKGEQPSRKEKAAQNARQGPEKAPMAKTRRTLKTLHNAPGQAPQEGAPLTLVSFNRGLL